MAKKAGEVTGVWIDARLCKGTEGCSICMDVCKEDVLGVAEARSPKGVHPAVVLKLENCTGCDLCMIHCPDLAITVGHGEAG